MTHYCAKGIEAGSILTCDQLIEAIQRVGLLPLLESGIPGFNAEAMVDEECRYVTNAEGGWDWALWKWKGPIVAEGRTVYGKVFNGKAGFVSRRWWPHLCNVRRAAAPPVEAGCVDELILDTLRTHGSMITRQLRDACGFGGPKMRSRFDALVTRLQMQCRVVTQDFVYPRDRHNREYGWGWALLTTPEQLLGEDACRCDAAPAESLQLMLAHLHSMVPGATPAQLRRLLHNR